MRLDAILAVLGLLGVATPAVAQRETQLGSRLTPRQTISSAQNGKEAVLAGHRLAGCLYLKQRMQVTSALNARDRDEATRKLNGLVVKGTCINLMLVNDFADEQRMRMPADIYRGVLAEAVIRNQFARQVLSPVDRQPTYTRDWFAVTGRPQAIDEMGACVADTNPVGVQALLTTTPETAEERAAISNLVTSLGPCLSADTKLTSNRQSLRAGLAEALYHRYAAPPSVPASASTK